MLKLHELKEPTSCLNRAHEEEMVFVLLARDAAAPAAIRAWCAYRIYHEKNRPGDSQITEALECARTMEEQRVRKPWADRTTPARLVVTRPLPDGAIRKLHLMRIAAPCTWACTSDYVALVEPYLVGAASATDGAVICEVVAQLEARTKGGLK